MLKLDKIFALDLDLFLDILKKLNAKTFFQNLEIFDFFEQIMKISEGVIFVPPS
jgi:hypothetical protein